MDTPGYSKGRRPNKGSFNRGSFGQKPGGGPVESPNNKSMSSSSEERPSASYYANSKFLSPPLPSALPMPPKSWIEDRSPTTSR